ncbi:SagB/ThcOx family dehydrogenase [Corynebacterium timonense]|uniref:SagB-type dehydrogenase domain-containing protein n=1 Tax=Corynebacterium timonense TaxID=441500 RepID=A0A1H1R1K4_9CORY|nr:SagB-type dehydrogenase domain-containing protein [Corynebacterium timonense]
MSSAADASHSANLREIVYNTGVPELFDPSEDYFEASKLTRDGLAWETPGIPPLLQSPELQKMSGRASRRYSSRPFIDLGEPDPLPGGLDDLLRARRSCPQFGGGELSLSSIHQILDHSYGAYSFGHGDQTRRNVPSGGALYPLDLYLLSRKVETFEPGELHHFDPYRKGLAHIRSDVDLDSLGEALLIPEVANEASAFVIISASFWRSRFKYSQRALRFCLMECGHVAQNLLTVSTSVNVQSRVFGGFIDCEVNSILADHNGVDDAALYVVLLGAEK